MRALMLALALAAGPVPAMAQPFGPSLSLLCTDPGTAATYLAEWEYERTWRGISFNGFASEIWVDAKGDFLQLLRVPGGPDLRHGVRAEGAGMEREAGRSGVKPKRPSAIGCRGRRENEPFHIYASFTRCRVVKFHTVRCIRAKM